MQLLSSLVTHTDTAWLYFDDSTLDSGSVEIVFLIMELNNKYSLLISAFRSNPLWLSKWLIQTI